MNCFELEVLRDKWNLTITVPAVSLVTGKYLLLVNYFILHRIHYMLQSSS